MATITNVTLIDSLNGSTEDVETVTFFHPMTGLKMEIELDPKNRKAMGTHLERLSKYFDAAVVVEVPVPAAPAKPKAAKNTEIAKMREWAKANGFVIGDRGRISAEIQEAYKASQEVIQPDAEVVQDLEIEVPSEAESVSEAVSEEAAPEVADTTVEELEGMTEADILELMADLEKSGETVTLDQLEAAIAENDNQE